MPQDGQVAYPGWVWVAQGRLGVWLGSSRTVALTPCLLQIPGKLLFSLVKRYLCVTSLVDKLNSSTELGGERQDCAVPCAHVGERSRMQREFEFSMAMANLISELVRVMGWDRSQRMELLSLQEGQPRVVRSIFQPKAPACAAVQVPLVTPKPSPRKKQGPGFLTLSDFARRSSYVEYVQESLKPGMMVRMMEDYEEISAGDEGEFRQSNNGMPPVQVSARGTEESGTGREEGRRVKHYEWRWFPSFLVKRPCP